MIRGQLACLRRQALISDFFISMKELITQIKALQIKIAKTVKLLDLAKDQTEIKVLAIKTSEADFWQDQKRAQEVSRRLEELSTKVSAWDKLQAELESLLKLAVEAQKTDEASLTGEITKELAKLAKDFSRLEFDVFLNGKYDANNAILAIHAGTGGVDAQDWAAMLMRMYLRFCEQKKFKATILNLNHGNEAGIKTVTLEINGHYAYGYLKVEAGVHRLVRISPFDAEKMRHTSFALVEVLPELGELEEIKIDPKDLRIDTFMAGGHGGQSVNTTYSAVRIVHLPTKISVECQNERSQQQNKETAMKVLRAKLHRIYEQEQQDEKQKIRGEYHQAGWSNQIRSYVLQPYKLVKDHRTKHETADVNAVLDGQLDSFIETALRQQVKG